MSKIFIVALILTVSGGAAIASPEDVVVYKSPTCTCCEKWIAHLEKNGFSVTARDLKNTAPVKLKYGVPLTATSCHTATVGGYVIEGHVPASDIKRLLKEKPPVRGLTAPGMSIGSPGMEQGDHRQSYTVYSFDEKGHKEVFSRH